MDGSDLMLQTGQALEPVPGLGQIWACFSKSRSVLDMHQPVPTRPIGPVTKQCQRAAVQYRAWRLNCHSCIYIEPQYLMTDWHMIDPLLIIQSFSWYLLLTSTVSPNMMNQTQWKNQEYEMSGGLALSSFAPKNSWFSTPKITHPENSQKQPCAKFSKNNTECSCLQLTNKSQLQI